MARTVGKKPREAALLKVWDFVHREIPDYIYGVFAPLFTLNERTLESDVALFIPHMGVFLMDVYNPTDIVMEDGRLYLEYGRSRRPFDPEAEGRRMVQRRFHVRKYLQENYHFTPLVFEMTCYPSVNISDEIKAEMGKVMDLDHVLFREDFEKGEDFLLKVHKESVLARKQTRGQNIFSEMMDEMAYLLFARWGVGLPDPPRPDKPPLVFLSYNHNDQQRAWEIKYELESRDIFVWRAPEDVMISDDYKILETEAIRNCDAFIILLSPGSMGNEEIRPSEEVRYEFETARASNKKIIPILIEDVDLSQYYSRNLSHIQYRKMFINDSNVFNEIAQVIKED